MRKEQFKNCDEVPLSAREKRQFLMRRRFVHDAVFAMIKSGAVKLPCADFSALKQAEIELPDKERDQSMNRMHEKIEEGVRVSCRNIALIEFLIKSAHEYLFTRSMNESYQYAPATLYDCFKEDDAVFDESDETDVRFHQLDRWLTDMVDYRFSDYFSDND